VTGALDEGAAQGLHRTFAFEQERYPEHAIVTHDRHFPGSETFEHGDQGNNGRRRKVGVCDALACFGDNLAEWQ
jgi:hypothetical protein